MDINQIDLTPYKAKVDGYILHKDIVMSESYTNEDVIIVGLRKLAKEKDWQLKHGSTTQKAIIAILEAKLAKYEPKA